MAKRNPPRKPAPRPKPKPKPVPKRQPPRRPPRGKPTGPPRSPRPPARPAPPPTPAPEPEEQSTGGTGAPTPPRRPGDRGDGTARQIYNPGGRGQDARYDVRGLSRGPDGYLTDGTYRYDDNGLSLDRPSTHVEGLKPADQMDNDQWGDYLSSGQSYAASGGGGGGGGGGGIIPGAGTYLFEQAMAEGAYDKAIAALKTQRRQRQVGAGLGEDWSVDPSAQYGGYQQMLRGQGLELDAADAQAMERGLQGAGLGRQAEGEARYGHTIQNLGFKSQLADWENEYQSGLGAAEFAKQQAYLDSLMGAMGDAYGDWGGDYGEESGGYQSAVIPPGLKPYQNAGKKQNRGRPTRPRPPARRPMAGFGGGYGQAAVRARQQQNRRPVPPRRPPARRGY